MLKFKTVLKTNSIFVETETESTELECPEATIDWTLELSHDKAGFYGGNITVEKVWGTITNPYDYDSEEIDISDFKIISTGFKFTDLGHCQPDDLWIDLTNKVINVES